MIRQAIVAGAPGVCLLIATAAAQAAQFQVDRFADSIDADPGDGLCADAVDGGCSLRAAVQEANALPGRDSIVLPAGTFTLSLAGSGEDLAASGDLDVLDALSIAGAGADASIVDAAALDRILDLHPPAAAIDVELADLTLRNGFLNTSGQGLGGAGLRVGAGVQLSLRRFTLRDCRAHVFIDAVGISNRGCIDGERVRILGNLDPSTPGSLRPVAGGVFTGGADSCFTLADSELSDNRGDAAGAVYADQGAPVTLRRTLIAHNQARFSGAMTLNSQNEVLLENVTISGNLGNGAILNDGGATLTLINSTVTGNRALASGAVVGGIHDVHGGFGRTFLSNTILSGNGPGSLADDCRTAVSLDGGNILGDSARCHHDMLPSDQLDVDPGLGPLADNGGVTATHLPGPNAIDRGVAGACAADDQRGVARPQDGDGDGEPHCDVGAVEAVDEVIFSDGFEPAA